MEAGHEFVWDPVKATNATHLNIGTSFTIFSFNLHYVIVYTSINSIDFFTQIGNEMVMDMGLPNHERMNFWQQLPVYWNANRDNYKPAPPIVFKDEL